MENNIPTFISTRCYALLDKHGLLNKDEELLGTKDFATPEQYGEKWQTDCRTDVYGLGTTLYYLITSINPSIMPFEIKPISYYRKDL